MVSRIQSNLVIGQVGGATAVINASLVGAFEAEHTDELIGGIYGMHYGVEGLLKEGLIDLWQQLADLWSRLLHTPSAALGSTHYHLSDEDLERVIEVLRRKNIRYLLYIGGKGSAQTVHRLVHAAQEKHYECYAVSVPKTIDNDLPNTDHCPGYSSAARFLALALIHSTMNMLSVPDRFSLKVIETVGRNVGWQTAASALGKHNEDDALHLILIPEYPFQKAQFLQQVESIYHRVGYAVIVATEALRDDQGHQLGPTEDGKTKSTAQYLGNLIKERLHTDVRFDKPGDLQWSEISTDDRDEAYLVARKG